MAKKTHSIVVPVGKTVVDVKGCRVGAGKPAVVDASEFKKIEKLIKTKEVKNGNN